MSEAVRICVCSCSFPDDFVFKIAFVKNLIEHDLDVVASVPIAMVVKAARSLEHAA